jgi:hypothetical protein
MTDNVHLVVTDKDGTVLDITGSLDAALITKTAPVVTPPVVTPPVVTPPVVIVGAPVIPADAHRENMLTKKWKGNHDAGTGGTASGTSSYPETSPDGRANCLKYDFDTNGGGMIYHVLALTAGASKFNKICYRKRERKTDPGGWKTINQVETDVEMTDIKTGIPTDLAMQQSATGGNGEEVTINHHWTPTGVKINPQLRDPNAWHLTENYMTLHADKTITYDFVAFDNVLYPIGKVGFRVTDQDSTPWGLDEANVQAQYNGIAGAQHHTVFLDIFEIVFWYDPTVDSVKAA